MKILFVMDTGFDLPGPSNHLFLALIEDTLLAGFDVHLIEADRGGADPLVPDVFLKYPGFTYETVKQKVVAKNRFASRYLELLRYDFSLRAPLRRARDADLVFVQSCPTAPFLVSIVRRIFGRKPIIYNVQDMFPGSSIASGVMKNRLMQKFFARLHRIAYRRADAVSVISDDMKLKVVAEGVPEEKVRVIVNWYDDRRIREVAWEENRFVKKYSLSPDKFYVQYAGTMGYVFDYKTVIETARRLEGYPDIVFQMIGEGSCKAAFMEEAKDCPNIVFYPLEPAEMVSDVYSACSICLIPLKYGVIGNSVPSKAGLLMAVGRTIVNSIDPESLHCRMFVENDIGLAASNLDPDSVAEAILRLYRDREGCRAMAERARVFGARYYSRTLNTAKYVDLFRELIEG